MKDTIYLQGKSEINHTINEQKRGVLVMCNESITIIRSRYDSMIEGMQTYIDKTKKLPKEEQKKRAIKNLHAIGIMDKEGNLIESHPLFPYIEEKTELQKEK